MKLLSLLLLNYVWNTGVLYCWEQGIWHAEYRNGFETWFWHEEYWKNLFSKDVKPYAFLELLGNAATCDVPNFSNVFNLKVILAESSINSSFKGSSSSIAHCWDRKRFLIQQLLSYRFPAEKYPSKTFNYCWRCACIAVATSEQGLICSNNFLCIIHSRIFAFMCNNNVSITSLKGNLQFI